MLRSEERGVEFRCRMHSGGPARRAGFSFLTVARPSRPPRRSRLTRGGSTRSQPRAEGWGNFSSRSGIPRGSSSASEARRTWTGEPASSRSSPCFRRPHGWPATLWFRSALRPGCSRPRRGQRWPGGRARISSGSAEGALRLLGAARRRRSGRPRRRARLPGCAARCRCRPRPRRRRLRRLRLRSRRHRGGHRRSDDRDGQGARSRGRPLCGRRCPLRRLRRPRRATAGRRRDLRAERRAGARGGGSRRARRAPRSRAAGRRVASWPSPRAASTPWLRPPRPAV